MLKWLLSVRDLIDRHWKDLAFTTLLRALILPPIYIGMCWLLSYTCGLPSVTSEVVVAFTAFYITVSFLLDLVDYNIKDKKRVKSSNPVRNVNTSL